MINITIIIVGFSLVVCCMILMKVRIYSVRRAMKIPKQSVCVEKEAEQCARNISMFLAERAKACGMYIHNMEGQCGVSYDEFHRIILGKDESILALIRIAQALGCEISVKEREVGEIRNN